MDNTAQDAERMGVLARQDPGEWSCPYRATGPGALQVRQADQDLGRSRTPGHPNGPGNLTRAGIAIRDACAGTEIPSLRAARSGG